MKTTALLATLLLVAVSGTALAQMEEMKAEHHFALPALDEFHELLHPLVHESFADNDFAAIRKQLDALLEKAEEIEDAEIPEKFMDKKEPFEQLSEQLITQLKEMQSLDDDKAFAEMFNEMHETFEQLAHLFQEES